jgi:hypothetical protein
MVMGPGSITQQGLYSVGQQNTGTYPVTIRVTNICGGYDDYAFNVVRTNNSPTFTNCGVVLPNGMELHIYDFESDILFSLVEPDTCDELLFSIADITPVPESMPTIGGSTGLFEWTPAHADAGITFTIVIAVEDGQGGEDACEFEIEILGNGVGDGPASVFAADFDGDGDLDLVTANSYSDNVSILLNAGDGSFEPAVNYAAGDASWAVFAADYDGDQDADLAVTNILSDNVSILSNNGDGTFQMPVNYSTGLLDPRSVFAADLDGDGDYDLAVANSHSSTSSAGVSILMNNGDGTFQAPVKYTLGTCASICAADLDGDDDYDLAIAWYVNNKLLILKNNGDGTFQAGASHDAGSTPLGVSAADLNGDDDIDLSVVCYSDAVSVFENNGDATFQPAVNYGVGDRPRSVVASDLDRDGDFDLAVANDSSDDVSVLRNSGTGTFLSADGYDADDGPNSVIAADLDGDRDADLAVANYNSDNVSVLINPGIIQPYSCGDVNADGVLNLLDAVYLAQYVYSGGPAPVPYLCVGDVTGDGFVDANDAQLLSEGGQPVDNCCDLRPGDACSRPIYITELPFYWTDTTALYNDYIRPDAVHCFDGDTLAGVGQEIVFSYTPAVNETLYVQVNPHADWDPVLYILEPGWEDSCIAVANSYGSGYSESLVFISGDGKPVNVVSDAANEQGGRGTTFVSGSETPKCANFSKPDPDNSDLTETRPEGVTAHRGTGNVADLLRQDKNPYEGWKICQFGYWIHGVGSSEGIMIAECRKPSERDQVTNGSATANVILTGLYRVERKHEYPSATHCRCELVVEPLRGRQMISVKEGEEVPADQLPESELRITTTFQPFGTMNRYLKGSTGGILTAAKDSTITKTEDAIVVMADVPFGVDDTISIEFFAKATAENEKTTAEAKWTEFKFKISCEDPPDEGVASSGHYPVRYGPFDIKVLPVSVSLSRGLTLPEGFSSVFAEVDSQLYWNGGIGFPTNPAYGSGLFLTNRLNPFSYDDSLGDVTYPADTSAILTFDGMQVDTFLTSSHMSGPSYLRFDTTGFFGNKLYATYATLFDEYGQCESEMHLIESIDAGGQVATFATDLDAPVGFTFSKGTPFGDKMYVVELETGNVVSVEPSGTKSVFTTDMKTPFSIDVGRGAFGEYLYVAEFDTTAFDSGSTAFAGKIVRVDVSGNRSTFVDGLQCPTDIAFGPGGDFGTDLYVLLYNEYNDSTVYEDGTGKIVTVNSAGQVTEFATGLDYPEYLVFDPTGILYVGTTRGILKIYPGLCGDADGSGFVDIDDIVFEINFVFAGGDPPVPYESGDADCSGFIDIDDIVYLIMYIFAGGPAPGEGC